MTTGNENTDSAFSVDHVAGFIDRRDPENQRKATGLERRQFSNSHSNLSADAAELGNAIDQYKLVHRRRFIDYEEMLHVIKSLGYVKQQNG